MAGEKLLWGDRASEMVYGKVPWGPEAIDWQERINMPRMREERAQRTRAKIKEHGYAVMCLGEGENRRYATAIHPGLLAGRITGAAGFTFVFADQPTAEMVDWELDGGLTLQVRRNCPWIKPENIFAVHSMAAAQGPEAVKDHAKKQAKNMVEQLRSRKLLKEKIAYDGLHPALIASLESEGVKLVQDSSIMVEARMIKTEDEVNCMRMGGVNADTAWGVLFRELTPGITERELGSKMAAAIFSRQQANNPTISLRSGPNTSPNYVSHSPQDRVIEPGDLVFADLINCGHSGYATCYYRTFKCGLKPTEKEKDWHKRCREWLYAAAAEIKPGKTTADAAKKFPTCDVWGFSEEYECLLNAIGHGHGLVQHEQPWISRTCSLEFPLPIYKNMIFAMETWMGDNRSGGCRIESVGVVTDNGWENLYAWPDEEIVVPAHQILY